METALVEGDMTLQRQKCTEPTEINNAAQIEVGLSKLQNTLSMLESNKTDNDIAIKALQDDPPLVKHDKNTKAFNKKNREVYELQENQIFAARLRSKSGRIYSSGLVVDSHNITAIAEETSPEVNMPICKQQPCSDSKCCKNTAKIVNMIAELQQSVNAIKNTTENQTLVGASNAGNIRRIEDQVQENSTEIKSLDEEMTDYKFQLKLLTNIVI